eukprot:CAMPEP_0194776438 /NCGR_PEP_ID=MMETSP0323_2-20130528/63101_1 /TAXON_ID=2866 ORGANISM="Crypthecodinium cohnii, Strain Seligo" /NCGR_SAMPLE_ID=MMETSP0323_2 /ASSEMBLY_ACC=CAM_ASM_000346 /LENGTH=41 /DNA_ID= /DNA_START= /DNA_END= /DNA_ORIENTATION=
MEPEAKAGMECPKLEGSGVGRLAETSMSCSLPHLASRAACK